MLQLYNIEYQSFHWKTVNNYFELLSVSISSVME